MKHLLAVVNESRKVFLELLGYLSKGRKEKETITATFKPEKHQLFGVSATPKGLPGMGQVLGRFQVILTNS